MLPAPIVVTRRSDGLVLYINRAGREMLELPAGDLAGLHAEAFYVDRADRSAMLDVLRSGAGPACLETRFVTARGREFWGRVSVTALPYGRTPALFAVVQDVTERRQAMDALHESQELFASFMDQIPAGIFIAGRDNRLRYGNRLLRELAGSAGDLLGRLPGEWIPGEFGRAMEEGARQALAGSASSREGRLDGAPGRKLDLLTFPVARDGRPRIVATVSDTGSGVAAWSLHCGDRWLLSAYDADDGRVVWERDEDLPPGAQTLTLRVEDGAGNRAEFTRNLVVGGK